MKKLFLILAFTIIFSSFSIVDVNAFELNKNDVDIKIATVIRNVNLGGVFDFIDKTCGHTNSFGTRTFNSNCNGNEIESYYGIELEDDKIVNSGQKIEEIFIRIKEDIETINEERFRTAIIDDGNERRFVLFTKTRLSSLFKKVEKARDPKIVEAIIENKKKKYRETGVFEFVNRNCSIIEDRTTQVLVDCDDGKLEEYYGIELQDDKIVNDENKIEEIYTKIKEDMKAIEELYKNRSVLDSIEFSILFFVKESLPEIFIKVENHRDSLIYKDFISNKKSVDEDFSFDLRIDNKIKYNSFSGLFLNIFNSLVNILLVISSLIIIIVGFKFIISQGNVDKIKRAKTSLLISIVGLLLVLSAKGLVLYIITVTNINI